MRNHHWLQYSLFETDLLVQGLLNFESEFLKYISVVMKWIKCESELLTTHENLSDRKIGQTARSSVL